MATTYTNYLPDTCSILNAHLLDREFDDAELDLQAVAKYWSEYQEAEAA